VSSDIPKFCVAVGSPARPIKEIIPKNSMDYII
jgi:acetyltransferase-like isoleucine patch superfamily enzyme